MKKFWIVLLSMGLLAAFSIPAFAIDVKFSGEYRVRGWYDKNPSGYERNAWSAGTAALVVANKPEHSASFYDQRLRIQTDFVVAEGLTLTTRFDALEKKWGGVVTPTAGGVGAVASDNSSRAVAVGDRYDSNIEFERVYVTFKSPIGLWLVGYQQFLSFGPDPANSSSSVPGIKYVLPIGDLMLIAAIEKRGESDVGANIGRWSDADQDVYDLGVVYKLGKIGDVGLMIQHAQAQPGRPFGEPVANLGSKQTFTAFDPYIRAKFGPVYIEAEGMYLDGELEWDNTAAAKAIGQQDTDLEEIAFFLHARVDLAPVYFGGYFGYGSGDDITTLDEREGGMAVALKAGSDFKPCLMLFNDDYATQFAGTTGVASLGSYMDNIWFYQAYVGFKPTPKLDVRFSYSYAEADEEVANVLQDKEYGSEIDAMVSYKIYDNLEYMLGGAYFMTGDFFKKGNAAIEVDDDYMLMHKLTLKF